MSSPTTIVPHQIDPLTSLPCGPSPQPLPLPHFPTRFQAVIWRNWPQMTPQRLAEVLETEASTILAEAAAMGLGKPASDDMQHRWLARGYITIIRQNWQLLPYNQLLQLLGWKPAQMAFVLKEEDFLWTKLGRLKPSLDRVIHHPLDIAQSRATSKLRAIIQSHASSISEAPAASPFDFVNHFNKPSPLANGTQRNAHFNLRLAYSYYGIYGDPLLSPHVDPYPDDMLARLADHGINAVWFQALLYTLVPWLGDIPESEGHEERITSLNKLIEKAAKYGIGVYPYLNEPRGMPATFFDRHPQWRGVYYPATVLCSMCMSCEEIPQRLEAGTEHLFTKAPGLAGVFTITMSENLTHCYSKPGIDKPCSRCASRPPCLIVAQVNNVIARGIHRAKPDAQVIAWNWSWGEHWSKEVIDNLSTSVKLMCTSETYLPTETLGVTGKLVDYSISRPGPGDYAKNLWQHARARGIEVIAKVQLNNTWECSAVPYLPVPFLVKKHLNQLQQANITGLMTSWTLGGYPGGNLALIDQEPEAIAHSLFGEAAAATICAAWKKFGDALENFPLHGSATLYHAPQNYGPMNLLYAQPTGYPSTMLGFPHDHLERWRGEHFPVTVFETAFKLLSEQWAEALTTLRQAQSLVPSDKQLHYSELHRIANATYCHFRSTFLQIRFIHLRDGTDPDCLRTEVTAILDEEIALAATLRDLCAADSRIGYEASNHYYYSQTTLMEKILNCHWLKEYFSMN